MVLENLSVKHKAFGDGTIVSTNGKYFTVKFSTMQKIFVYPDIFEKFLTLSDGTVPGEILVDLEASKAAKQSIIDKKNAENLHAMKHGIVIPGKEPVPESEEEDAHFNKDNEEV
jgi:hypothetical protein